MLQYTSLLRPLAIPWQSLQDKSKLRGAKKSSIMDNTSALVALSWNEKVVLRMARDIVWITMHYDNLAYLSNIFSEHGYDISVQYSALEDFFNTAYKCVQTGTKVLIMRGGIGTTLKQKISVPVVDLKNTYIDYYATLDKAFRLADWVALVGWYRYVKNFNRILEHSGSQLQYVELEPYSDVRDSNYIKDILLESQRSGINVVVGGGAVVEQAKKIGMTGLYVGLEKDSVIDAAEEALHLLRVVYEQQSRQDIITSIFNCVSDGVVAVDTRGFATNANKLAKSILNLDNDVYRYQRFSEIIGYPDLQETFQRGTRLTNQIIHNAGKENITLVLSSEPIMMDNELIGAVYTLQNAELIQSANKRLKVSNIERGLYAKYNFDHIIGSSCVMAQLKAKAIKYAETDATVLITGESGTGKELFAQSIHNESTRRGKPFVALNCAAVPESLLESELFGYVKGSFTGARTEGKEGVFERANHGTLFLDEIGEISIKVQAQLLRAIQEKEIMRIGDDRIIPVDVRILAATNAELETAVKEGRFRRDLYYRLCVLPLHLAPVRERGEDVMEIIHYLLRVHGRKSYTFLPEAKQLLTQYSWPGNVREISNFVERIGVILDHPNIDAASVQKILNLRSKPSGLAPKLQPVIEQDSFEFHKKLNREDIVSALVKNRNSRKRTAQDLGISTTTLWRKMKQFNI